MFQKPISKFHLTMNSENFSIKVFNISMTLRKYILKSYLVANCHQFFFHESPPPLPLHKIPFSDWIFFSVLYNSWFVVKKKWKKMLGWWQLFYNRRWMLGLAGVPAVLQVKHQKHEKTWANNQNFKDKTGIGFWISVPLLCCSFENWSMTIMLLILGTGGFEWLITSRVAWEARGTLKDKS